MAKKYFWLKLQKDFFKRHDIRIIESMPNGKDYILFYMKLLVESITHDGELRFSDTIPYDENMLATITNTNIDVVRSAIKIFSELHLMEVWDNGTFYMSEINKMIGSESASANRVRKHREKQKALQCNTTVTKSNIEKEKELELEKEQNIDDTSPDEQEGETIIDSIEYKIFEYWNSLEIIKHREMNDKMLKAITKTLKNYTPKVIAKAMKNYNTVIKDSEYDFSYKWKLVDFLKQGNALEDFVDGGSKIVNYLDWKSKPQSNKNQNSNSNFDFMDLGGHS